MSLENAGRGRSGLNDGIALTSMEHPTWMFSLSHWGCFNYEPEWYHRILPVADWHLF